MTFAGEEFFTESRTSLWERLTETAFVSRCLPDVEGSARCEPHIVECRVAPRLAFLRGTLQIRLELVGQQAGESSRMQIQARGIGSSIEVLTTLEFSDFVASSNDNEGQHRTKVRWTAEVQRVGGLLKPVGKSLIEAAARKVIADGWARVREQLAADCFK